MGPVLTQLEQQLLSSLDPQPPVSPVQPVNPPPAVGIITPAGSTVVQPEEPPEDLGDLSLRNDAVTEFLKLWKTSPEVKSGGVMVLGRRLKKGIADELTRRSVEMLMDELSINQLPGILLDNRLTVQAYFKTLADIRDNQDSPPKMRMEAADKILKTVVTFLKAHTTPDRRPPVVNQMESDSRTNMLGVMVNVSGPISTGSGVEIKHVEPINDSATMPLQRILNAVNSQTERPADVGDSIPATGQEQS